MMVQYHVDFAGAITKREHNPHLPEFLWERLPAAKVSVTIRPVIAAGCRSHRFFFSFRPAQQPFAAGSRFCRRICFQQEPVCRRRALCRKNHQSLVFYWFFGIIIRNDHVFLSCLQRVGFLRPSLLNNSTVFTCRINSRAKERILKKS